MVKVLEKEYTPELKECSRVRKLVDRNSEIMNRAMREMVNTGNVRHLTAQEKEEIFEADIAVNSFLDNYAWRTGKVLITSYQPFYKTI